MKRNFFYREERAQSYEDREEQSQARCDAAESKPAHEHCHEGNARQCADDCRLDWTAVSIPSLGPGCVSSIVRNSFSEITEFSNHDEERKHPEPKQDSAFGLSCGRSARVKADETKASVSE